MHKYINERTLLEWYVHGFPLLIEMAWSFDNGMPFKVFLWIETDNGHAGPSFANVIDLTIWISYLNIQKRSKFMTRTASYLMKCGISSKSLFKRIFAVSSERPRNFSREKELKIVYVMHSNVVVPYKYTLIGCQRNRITNTRTWKK